MNRILTVVGARPQFIKSSVVSKAISEVSGLEEVLVHTGQHFDRNMSSVFFEQLAIPAPKYELGINRGSHGEMTGKMLIEIERVVTAERPDVVMVYGDTNSTLAAALAAVKLHIPIAHVEAGLRSFNMKMPEEVNRVLTDQVSDFLFCPTDVAVRNLENEGFMKRNASILKVGDVMQDAALLFDGVSETSLKEGFGDGSFILATLHRAENTDCPVRLASIVSAINDIHKNVAPVVMPLHPRSRAAIRKANLELKVKVLEPVGYLDMIALLRSCALVLTDSGGLQKESFFFKKHCIVMRDQTEWVELVDIGANALVGADRVAIKKGVEKYFGQCFQGESDLYGGGKASERIASFLAEF